MSKSQANFDPFFDASGSDGQGDPTRFFNRDHSWLEFNARVLEMCADPRTPLLERVRFMAIYTRNLDEFYMKRVGAMRHAIETGVSATILSRLLLHKFCIPCGLACLLLMGSKQRS